MFSGMETEFVDSDEELFIGTVTPREIQLLKQRGLHVSAKKTTEEEREEVAMSEAEPTTAPASGEMEGAKKMTRDDFDSTWDYMDYVFEDGGGDGDAEVEESAGKENIEPVAPVEEVISKEEKVEPVEAAEISDRPPTPMPAALVPPPIVLGPYSPITPDCSFHEQPRDLPDVVVAASPRTFLPSVKKTPVAAVAPLPHNLVPAEIVVETSSSAVKRPVRPANIRFAMSEKPVERQAAQKRPAPVSASARKATVKPSVAKTKVVSALQANPTPSPVRQYIDGVVDRMETLKTPLSRNIKLAQEEVITPTPVRPPVVTVPQSSGKKTVFPRLGEIASAGRLVLGGDNREPTGLQAFKKLGRVPIEVEGEMKDYSVYEME